MATWRIFRTVNNRPERKNNNGDEQKEEDTQTRPHTFLRFFLRWWRGSLLGFTWALLAVAPMLSTSKKTAFWESVCPVSSVLPSLIPFHSHQTLTQTTPTLSLPLSQLLTAGLASSSSSHFLPVHRRAPCPPSTSLEDTVMEEWEPFLPLFLSLVLSNSFAHSSLTYKTGESAFNPLE